MQINKLPAYGCVVLSALLYVSSLIFIEVCWIASLFFLIPLYSILLFSKTYFSIGHALVWSIFAYGLQLIALIDFIVMHTDHHMIGGMLVGVFLSFISLFTFLWFFVLNASKKADGIVQMIVVVGSTLLFFIFIDRYSVVMLTGALGGYPFSLPILPLVYASSYVQKIIPLVGGIILVGILSALQWLCLRYNKLEVLLIGIMFFGFQKNEFQWYAQEKDPAVCVVQAPYTLSNSSINRMLGIINLVERASFLNSQAQFFVLPESIFPFEQGHEQLVNLLLSVLSQKAALFIGVYRSEHNNLVNATLCLKHDLEYEYYRKSILIPFFEYMPSLFVPYAQALNGCSFSSYDNRNKGPQDIWSSQEVYCLLCAELFWSDMPSKSIILGQVNDRHFRFNYFRKLLYVTAYYRSLLAQSRLFYSHYE